jgi:predicted nuclease of predicted toxin-antitoxin system
LGRPTDATRVGGPPLVDGRRTNGARREILTWAREHQFVLITNDLDFSAILAATFEQTPSVVQVRTQDLLSEVAVSIVVRAVEAYREAIAGGALLSIDEAGTRVRMLPLGRSQDLT